MRSLFVLTFFLIASNALGQTRSTTSVAMQDTSVIQDSSGTRNLRPRWGAYIVGIFPSPAASYIPITIQTYNLNPVEMSLKVYDLSGRLMMEIVHQQMLAGGLKTYTISPFLLASGEYIVEFETYTASGAVDNTEMAHFLIVH